MTIIAERGPFVRLPVQSGKVATPDGEALADALDAATREPATKAELLEAKAELKADIAEVRADIGLLRQRIDQTERNLDAKIDANNDKLTVRLGGIGLALPGALFAALRFTTP